MSDTQPKKSVQDLIPSDEFYKIINDFISDIVITYLFVETTSNFVLKKKSKLLFFSVFIFSLSVFIFVLFVFYLFGENILTIIFNKNFSIYYKELLLLSIAYSILGLCKIIVYILISNKMWKFFLILYLIFLTFLYFLGTYSLDMHSFILSVLYLFISNLFIFLNDLKPIFLSQFALF
jgi:hypothetical protein